MKRESHEEPAEPIIPRSGVGCPPADALSWTLAGASRGHAVPGRSRRACAPVVAAAVPRDDVSDRRGAERIQIGNGCVLVVLTRDRTTGKQHKDAADGVILRWETAAPCPWSRERSGPLHALVFHGGDALRITGASAEIVRGRLELLTALEGSARVAACFHLLADLAAAPRSEVQFLRDESAENGSEGVRADAMARAVAHIRAHYREPIRLEELQRLTHMSRATFARHFREYTGSSFSTFLNRVRLEAVCAELRNTSEFVGCIAFEHGFNQLSFFNRLFRREKGMSPSRYRALCRAEAFSQRHALAS